jgi:NitT/TauT family transport system permease protein
MATEAVRTTTSRPRRKAPASTRRVPERLIFGLAGFLFVLVIWEGLSRAGLIKLAVFSSPTAIWTSAVRDIGNGTLWTHLLVSGQEYVFGLALSVVVAIPLGLLIGMFWRVNYLLDPWLSAIYATPSVALVPLIILLFGIGLESKIVVVFLEAFILITVATITGVTAAEAKHHELAESFRASRLTRFTTVTLPSSVPFMLTGMRLGVGRGIVGVVVAEFLAANEGIGFYIALNGSLLQSSRVYLGIIILGILGLVMGEGIRRVERRFDRWRPAIN